MYYRKVDPSELTVDMAELAKRLSSPDGVPLSDDRYKRLLLSIAPAYVAELLPIEKRDNGIYIGGIFTQSRAFAKVCEECRECYIMVCTLGLGTDRLITKESGISVYDAFVLDAMADALVEAVCDLAEKEISNGHDVLPRFSPGYADFELGVGREIVKRLGAEVKLGIKFTEGGMMIPRKSVSAVVCIK